MNDLVSNKRTGYLLIIALVAVLLGAIYYFLIYPLNEEKTSKEATISIVENEIALLDAESIAPVDVEEKSVFLERKVPITRELDTLIQSIEEVELVSEAKIESIEFNNYDEIVADSSLVTSEEEASTDSVDVTEGEQPTETPVSPVASTPLPPQLKLITFNISVLTKDYDHFNTFIKELESMERTKSIDRVEFSMPGEEQNYDEETEEAISAVIQVTTFYYDKK
ncbi:potassium transporter [Psychrobacillus sp. NPDC096623]|uniref:potassium transporter n=1 Tax=Psychrobacillus sp. NPDC096623 TaxID=3364492 RepID=UPI0038208E10